eukprot:1161623-Pelagomonas_calceolata.AAC.14
MAMYDDAPLSGAACRDAGCHDTMTQQQCLTHLRLYDWRVRAQEQRCVPSGRSWRLRRSYRLRPSTHPSHCMQWL